MTSTGRVTVPVAGVVHTFGESTEFPDVALAGLLHPAIVGLLCVMTVVITVYGISTVRFCM